MAKLLEKSQGGKYEITEGWDPTMDLKGKESHEVKSFKADGRRVYVPRETFLNCQSDYIDFVAVDNDGNPLGYALITEWSNMKNIIRETPESERWQWTKDGERQVYSLSMHELLKNNLVIYVTSSTKGKIKDLIANKVSDSLL